MARPRISTARIFFVVGALVVLAVVTALFILAMRVPETSGVWQEPTSGARIEIVDGVANFKGIYLENGSWDSASRDCIHVGSATDGQGPVWADAYGIHVLSVGYAPTFEVNYAGPLWDKSRVLLYYECGPDSRATTFEKSQ